MLTKKEPETFTYEEAAAYIEEIPKFTKKHTLEHTKMFLKRLGNPAADRKIVHVYPLNTAVFHLSHIFTALLEQL